MATACFVDSSACTTPHMCCHPSREIARHIATQSDKNATTRCTPASTPALPECCQGASKKFPGSFHDAPRKAALAQHLPAPLLSTNNSSMQCTTTTLLSLHAPRCSPVPKHIPWVPSTPRNGAQCAAPARARQPPKLAAKPTCYYHRVNCP